MLERLSAPPNDVKRIRRIHDDDIFFLFAPFTWLGWLVPILAASSICTPICAIVITTRYLLLKRRLASAPQRARA